MCALLVQPNNFQVENDITLDDRFVRADEASRLAMPFKYVGLSVFQIDNQSTYQLVSIGPDVWNQTSGSSSGHVIEDDGTPVANQPNLNFLAGIDATDNPGASSTDITLDIDGGVEP
jgi:hypothetical protein